MFCASREEGKNKIGTTNAEKRWTREPSGGPVRSAAWRGACELRKLSTRQSPPATAAGPCPGPGAAARPELSATTWRRSTAAAGARRRPMHPPPATAQAESTPPPPTSPLGPGALVPTPVCSPALTDRVQRRWSPPRRHHAAPHALRSACRAPACMLALQILSCLHTAVFCMHCSALLPLAMHTLKPFLTFFLSHGPIDRTRRQAGRRLTTTSRLPDAQRSPRQQDSGA